MNMKKTMTTTLFGLCLLLAACSQDDMPDNANHDGAMRQVALSVTLPEGMTTRAVTDDDPDPAPTRCYVQMFASNGAMLPDDFSTVQQMTPNADGSFGLTVMLNPDDKYDFLFWADNDADAAAPEDLHNVPYTANGKTIAFAARAQDQRYNQSGIQVNLKHVVTRVTVVTTVPTDIDGTHTLTVGVPRCYTAYDVSTMQPLTESGKTGFEYRAFQSTQTEGSMGHFYLIGNSQTATLVLQYTADEITTTAEASNVPLNPDYHITLKGAVPNIGLADFTITATVTTDWGTTVEKDIIGYTFDGSTYTVYNAIGLRTWAEAAKSNNWNCTLAEDIDLTGINWTPIGTSISNAYKGTFDGGGHTITGLTVTTSDQYAGLFGYIDTGGKVKDVTLKDVKIESNNGMGYVGGVAGFSYGTLENCSVSGSVSGSGSSSNVGGVVGYQMGGSITGCSSSATVKGTQRAGGVAGVTNSGATLTACYATGDVTLVSNGSDTYYAGGVVGTNGGGILTACYAWGSVTGSGSGTVYVGGVTGTNDSGTLTACYHAKGTVSGPAGTTGGVAGRNYGLPYGGIITACYWGGNGQEQGIGENQAGTTGGTTQVTDGNWSGAKDDMNKALENTGWNYDLNKDGLPVLPPTI